MGLIHIVTQQAISNNDNKPEDDWKVIILWFKILLNINMSQLLLKQRANKLLWR